MQFDYTKIDDRIWPSEDRSFGDRFSRNRTWKFDYLEIGFGDPSLNFNFLKIEFKCLAMQLDYMKIDHRVRPSEDRSSRDQFSR